MRLRGGKNPDAVEAAVDEIIEHRELAPNLLEALKATFLP
jgi:hypothetical protein